MSSPLTKEWKQAVQLVADGMPVKQVAAQFGVKRCTVYKWMQRAGVEPNKVAVTKANKTAYPAALALRREGMSTVDACDAAGISVSMFYYHARQDPDARDVVAKRKGYSPTPMDVRQRAVARVLAGESGHVVAADIGVHRSALYRWVNKAKKSPLTYRQQRKQVHQQARTLYREGVSVEEIATRLGASPQSVVKWVNDGDMPATLPLRPAPYDPTQPAERIGRGNRLDLEDRIAIQTAINNNASIRHIACELGLHHSVVAREVRRNGTQVVDRNGNKQVFYSANRAQRNADARRARPKQRKLDRYPKLRAAVIAAMGRKWSPKRIETWLAHDFAHDKTMQISHEAIYQAIYIQGAGSLRKELEDYMHNQNVMIRAGKKRKPRKRTAGILTTRKTWVKGAEIITRPPEVDDRRVPGHWEGDLVIGAGGKSALITLVERTTRYTLLGHLPTERTSKTVVGMIQDMVKDIDRDMLKTITWDQGSEMSQTAHERITEACEVYFCDPHSPWQRPTNENTNGEIRRRFYPKDTDFAKVDADHVRWVQDELNDTPRVVLGGRRPRAMMEELLARGAFTA